MCHEGQSLSGARDRIDVRPVGSSLGVLTDPAMMSAAFARAPWPSFQRHLSSIKSTPGCHWAGVLQNSGTTIATHLRARRRPATMPRKEAPSWRREI